MSRLCLDTSAYSHFKRGADCAIRAISAARWIGMPVIVLGELRTGFKHGSRYEENERELMGFLSHPVVEVIGVDDEAAEIYSDMVVLLRRQGTPLPTNDIWIAAVTARAGATVLTFDDHFRHITRVGSKILTV